MIEGTVPLAKADPCSPDGPHVPTHDRRTRAGACARVAMSRGGCDAFGASGLSTWFGSVFLMGAVVCCAVDDVDGANLASVLVVLAAACVTFGARRLASPADSADAYVRLVVAGQTAVGVVLSMALVVIALWLPRQSILLPVVVTLVVQGAVIFAAIVTARRGRRRHQCVAGGVYGVGDRAPRPDRSE